MKRIPGLPLRPKKSEQSAKACRIVGRPLLSYPEVAVGKKKRLCHPSEDGSRLFEKYQAGIR